MYSTISGQAAFPFVASLPNHERGCHAIYDPLVPSTGSGRADGAFQAIIVHVQMAAVPLISQAGFYSSSMRR
jgi:hypothetical protein